MLITVAILNSFQFNNGWQYQHEVRVQNSVLTLQWRRNELFRHCWEQVLIHFISANDHSASVLFISRVQAMTKRRWMFGKASSSQAPSASKRLFGSSLSVDFQSVFQLLTSFLRNLGNGMYFSQNGMPSTSSSSRSGLFTIIDSTRQSRWRARRSSSKINLAFGWLRSQEEVWNKLLVLIDWTGTYIITNDIIFGMKKG